MATILVGADPCPIEGNQPYFVRGDAESLFHDLLPEIRSADLAIANLEGPLIDSPSPIPKTGPIFGEPSGCIAGIRNAGFHALCLANNHILDHGARGLENTLRVCAGAGIATVGAGQDLASASASWRSPSTNSPSPPVIRGAPTPTNPKPSCARCAHTVIPSISCSSCSMAAMSSTSPARASRTPAGS
jgi:Bacterial capsule synthesis protein PGA_cap